METKEALVDEATREIANNLCARSEALGIVFDEDPEGVRCTLYVDREPYVATGATGWDALFNVLAATLIEMDESVRSCQNSTLERSTWD